MSLLDTVQLGESNVNISRMGFGAMHLADAASCSPEAATTVLHRVLELGVTLIDTADRYCTNESDAHCNERQIAAALSTYTGDASTVCVATKGGMLRPGGKWVRFGKPDHIRQTIRESFEALGGDKPITLWQYHQYDRNYPLEETLSAVQESVDKGLIQHVGVSNFTVDQLERARQVVELVAVQNEFSLVCRAAEQDKVLEYCQREGLSFFAWRPLGGRYRAKQLNDNQAVVNLAAERNASPQQLALAWLLAKSPQIVPIPGSTHLASVEACVHAAAITLDEREIQLLEASVGEEPPSLRLTTI